MECEICGKEIYGRAYRSIVDGAKLLVCSECSQFASASWRPESKKQTPIPRQIPPRPMPQFQVPRRQPPTRVMEELELVEDYGQRIRRGREKQSLTHEELSRKIGERISVLQKLETGKMVPDRALAKKLENSLKVKLLEPPLKISDADKTFAKSAQDLTLGDIVVVQQKKPANADVEEEERGQ